MLQTTFKSSLMAPTTGVAPSRTTCVRMCRRVHGKADLQKSVMGLRRVQPERTVADLTPLKAAAGDSSTPGESTESENKYFVPFWKGQIVNLLGNLVLSGGALVVARGQDALTKTALLGSLAAGPVFDWFRLGLCMSSVFHVFVATSWRGQLDYKFYTRLLGEKGGLYTYTTLCFSTICIRLAVIIVCALKTGGVLWKPTAILAGLLAIPSVPIIYAFLSFQWELGVLRRCGADHFDPEYYKSLPLVTTGIFRFMDNPLYSFAALVYLLPGLFTGSLESVLVGVQVYIAQWLLWYSVEADDMEAIYGK